MRQSFQNFHFAQSTQQILHPEKYFDKVVPAEPKFEKFEEAKNYKKLMEGGLGEFDIKMLLKQYAGKTVSDELSPHWRGGRIAVFEAKKDKHPYRPLNRYSLKESVLQSL